MKTYLLAVTLFLTCCADPEKRKIPGNVKNADAAIVADSISHTRITVKKEPVVAYRERTDNPLNDWYFSVRLYETSNTFHYLIKLQFEEIRGIDTLRLPNFGIRPEPVIVKGKEKYSCIIGFLDKEKKFREYKKVYVKNNALKITALRHYAVREIISN